VLVHTAGEIMNAKPMTIAPEAFAGDALALIEERNHLADRDCAER
jgi:hypothetical protein